MNKALLMSLFILIIVGICVSRVKYEVVFLRQNLDEINRAIERCNDDIKVHTAEWSYLNTPDRLKTLCAKYLKNMKPLENSQVISYEKLARSDFQISLSKTFEAFLNNVAREDIGENDDSPATKETKNLKVINKQRHKANKSVRSEKHKKVHIGDSGSRQNIEN
jgi:hypothetical protein